MELTRDIQVKDLEPGMMCATDGTIILELIHQPAGQILVEGVCHGVGKSAMFWPTNTLRIWFGDRA